MSVKNVNDAEFLQSISSESGVIVKYYADWCGSCKLFAPKFKRMALSNENITFLEVNAEENPEARKLGGVNNLPFIATFKKGQLIQGFATSKEDVVAGMLKELK